MEADVGNSRELWNLAEQKSNEVDARMAEYQTLLNEAHRLKVATEEAEKAAGLAAYQVKEAIRDHGRALEDVFKEVRERTDIKDESTYPEELRSRNRHGDPPTYAYFAMQYEDGRQGDAFTEDGMPNYESDTWREWKVLSVSERAHHWEVNAPARDEDTEGGDSVDDSNVEWWH